MTKKAFENAITVMMALGGSTNAVLHLLAIAREAEVDLVIDDFNRIADNVPFVGNLKPAGKVQPCPLPSRPLTSCSTQWLSWMRLVVSHLL